ncbi:glypican-6-like [Ptychodera flava]|uniref:glypican-6-like n=1 Tax=Ptychodera flava TaxID=63121 RepID=UPI00396AA011
MASTSTYLWTLGLLAFLTSLVDDTFAGSKKMACVDVIVAYSAIGKNPKDCPKEAISGEHLKVCPQGFTCCTAEMEEELTITSKEQFEDRIYETSRFLRETLKSRWRKFDDFFKELLEKAENDLHEMFIRTYGLLYQQNAYVFTELFKDLRSYYEGEDMDLLDAQNEFFVTLFQKMFQLLNAQYSFDDAYMSCVSEFVDELQPFGDVPHKLSLQINRAFIAARTFVQGLAIGADVAEKVAQVYPTEECSQALMKMSYCPHCKGLTTTKPCNNFCVNVMKGCLASHADLDTEWNNYIEKMLKLAERLEGPFNIESVIDPIDVKISDAIMNFQDGSVAVSEKVFGGCGTPQLGKRSTNEFDFDPSRLHPRGNQPRPTTAAGTSLDRLVKDIRGKIKLAKRFWSGLPYTVCNDENVAAVVANEEECWNGENQARYEAEIVGDGLLQQANNPEVEVDVNKPDMVVRQEIERLKLMSKNLEAAYHGQSVNTIAVVYDVSGSGSGSGSGEEDGPKKPSIGVIDHINEDVINRPNNPVAGVAPSICMQITVLFTSTILSLLYLLA